MVNAAKLSLLNIHTVGCVFCHSPSLRSKISGIYLLLTISHAPKNIHTFTVYSLQANFTKNLLSTSLTQITTEACVFVLALLGSHFAPF